MKTSEKEYNELLYVIQDPNNLINEPVYYRIPANEPVYTIDLNTREIEAPEFFGVTEDHNAEVVLYDATCWIQYKNALKEDYVAVTIPRVIEDNSHNTLYIPWPIRSTVTKATGNVTFSFYFFKIGEDKKVYFKLHTKSATSKVLNGLQINADKFIEDGTIDNDQYTEFMRMYQELTNAYSTLSKNYELYWLEG